MGLTREDLFAVLGVVKPGPELNRITMEAYDEYERQLAKDERIKTSFFGSDFPVGAGPHCARKALYSLAGACGREKIPPKGIAIMEMGKAAEEQTVYRWARSKLLLAGAMPIREGAGEMDQLHLTDSKRWLSSRIDAILGLRPEWNSILPVEIKSKSDAAISEMERGVRDYDPKHYGQLQSYIYLCRLFHFDMGWGRLGYRPADGGMLYYVSRENPIHSKEYYFPYDFDEVSKSLDRLDGWHDQFLDDELPPRPKEWRWTAEPCKWCPSKKVCKQDIRDDVEKISESSGFRGEGQYKARRAAVLDRWKGVTDAKQGNPE